jgi:hypothetical protein
MEFYFSHHLGNVIIPSDELHHFSEGAVMRLIPAAWLVGFMGFGL